MIPRSLITEWKEQAPWPDDGQVEQDMVIERAICEIFSHPLLREHLAFRGGTALHKLYLKPQARYSEDIDLVQIIEGPIKPIFVALREALDFLGQDRSIKQGPKMNTVVYRFDSEIPPVRRLRLKIEINCREHFSHLGYVNHNFEMDSYWYHGIVTILTYRIEELLATKLRALYQRDKGRDLFDMYHALSLLDVDHDLLINTYKAYMTEFDNRTPSQKEFRINLEKKILDANFSGDIYALLRPAIEYDQDRAFEMIDELLIFKM